MKNLLTLLPTSDLSEAEGRAEGKAEEVRNLITKLGMTNEQAADIAGVSLDFVKKVRRKLKK